MQSLSSFAYTCQCSEKRTMGIYEDLICCGTDLLKRTDVSSMPTDVEIFLNILGEALSRFHLCVPEALIRANRYHPM